MIGLGIFVVLYASAIAIEKYHCTYIATYAPGEGPEKTFVCDAAHVLIAVPFLPFIFFSKF